jgi:ribosomal protein L16 Arg81 hydroxylase
MNGKFDLSTLLGPLTTERFLAEHWESKPLLLQRRDSAYYDSLLTIADVERYISRGDARYPAIRIAKSGAFYAPEAYTHDVRYGDEVFRGVADLERIFSEYSSGATVTLPALHLGWPPLGRLCRQLEAELDHSVHTNAYLTPANAAGFTPHYDTHEVFVLQICGTKHWRVYAPQLKLPHRSQPFSPERYKLPSEPVMDFDLAAGDLLYLPRGYVHTTTTAEHFSAHVTIGITVYTWVELASELLQSSIELEEFRAALPPGFAHRPAESAELSERLPALMDRLRAALDSEVLGDRFAARVRNARPRAPIEFRADAFTIGPDTPLRIVEGTEYQLFRDRDGLVLELNGRRVRLQTAVAPALEALSRTESLTPRSLPPDISLEARLALARYLHGLGFLRRLA